MFCRAKREENLFSALGFATFAVSAAFAIHPDLDLVLARWRLGGQFLTFREAGQRRGGGRLPSRR
jgi:hypothetical protein